MRREGGGGSERGVRGGREEEEGGGQEVNLPWYVKYTYKHVQVYTRRGILLSPDTQLPTCI